MREVKNSIFEKFIRLLLLRQRCLRVARQLLLGQQREGFALSCLWYLLGCVLPPGMPSPGCPGTASEPLDLQTGSQSIPQEDSFMKHLKYFSHGQWYGGGLQAAGETHS